MEKDVPAPTTAEVIRTLQTVVDPELGIDVWTLGLIYDLAVEGDLLKIRMTFTSIGCPTGEYLIQEIKERCLQIPGIRRSEIEVVFSPPWQPPDDLKATLGIL